MRDVPEGRVNLAGGNFLHRRVDFSIDSLFGVLEVGASYNSATRGWQWSFDMTYDGENFLDDSGAVHDLSLLPVGRLFPVLIGSSSTTKASRPRAGWFIISTRIRIVWWR